MAYNKTDAAAILGISKSEFEARAKAAGFSDTESYFNSIGGTGAGVSSDYAGPVSNGSLVPTPAPAPVYSTANFPQITGNEAFFSSSSTGGYNKTDAAAALGISKEELEVRSKAAGFSDTESYVRSLSGATPTTPAAPATPTGPTGPTEAEITAALIDTITQQMVEFDRQIDELTPYLSLTDQEKQAFLDKAISEITPYYDRKKAELDASIREGKVRTAEDILTNIKQVEEETTQTLAKYDLTSAQTEDEFLKRLADITSTFGEDISLKEQDYKQRLELTKFNQVKQGILTSGIGAKKVAEQERAKQLEEQIMSRRAEESKIEATANKTYTLDQITLARKAAEEQRIRLIGTPAEAASTKAAAANTLGISDPNQIASPEEIARRRAESGITPSYDTTKYGDLAAEKITAGIATQQELQADELARRQAEYGAQIDKIKAQQAQKAASLTALRGY